MQCSLFGPLFKAKCFTDCASSLQFYGNVGCRQASVRTARLELTKSVLTCVCFLTNRQDRVETLQRVYDTVSVMVNGMVNDRVRGMVNGMVNDRVSGMVNGMVNDRVSSMVNGMVNDRVSSMVNGMVNCMANDM